MKEKIEITSDLLARIKNKAGKATQGNWFTTCDNKLQLVVNCVALDRYETRIANFDNNPYSEKNADFIAAANPSVMLALITKIEEQEMELHYMRSWAELDKEETSKQLEWIRELQKLLGLEVNGLMKNTRTEILEKIKSLVSHE